MAQLFSREFPLTHHTKSSQKKVTLRLEHLFTQSQCRHTLYVKGKVASESVIFLGMPTWQTKKVYQLGSFLICADMFLWGCAFSE